MDKEVMITDDLLLSRILNIRFNAMREVLRTSQELLLKLEKIDKRLLSQGYTLKQHNEEIGVLFELIDQLRKQNEKPPIRNPIGFKPQTVKK